MREGRKGTFRVRGFHEGSRNVNRSGVLKIYAKSVENLKLCFTSYIGGSYSNAYPTVVKAQPYGPNKKLLRVNVLVTNRNWLVGVLENSRSNMVVIFWLITRS